MLKVTIPARPGIEMFDEETQTFISLPERKEQTLELEHSLISLSKWESKWCVAFISKNRELTQEQSIDYIRCMSLDDSIPIEVFNEIPEETFVEIMDYINAPMTASVIPKMNNQKSSREVVTSELIYYWMTALNIPFEPCQNWHLNKLMTFIEVCSVKSAPPKKMGKRSLTRQYADMNAARRKQLGTKG